MKKICFLLVAIVTSGFSIFAQTKSDPDAKKILDAVSAKFKSYKAVQASFTYKENGPPNKKGSLFPNNPSNHVNPGSSS